MVLENFERLRYWGSFRFRGEFQSAGIFTRLVFLAGTNTMFIDATRATAFLNDGLVLPCLLFSG
jgi:hypothetical protein